MKRAGIVAIFGAFALIAACSQNAPEQEGPDQPQGEEASTAANDGGEAGAATDGAAAPSSAELAGALACVKDVPADAICTMDLNQCGHSGSCNCGPGYIYNASMGKCLLIMDGMAEAQKADIADDECVKAPAGACTRDINVCGQPSNCQCEEGFAWNAVAGKCVKS